MPDASMRLKRFNEAEAIYRQILKEHPEHHEVQFNLGVILGQQGKYEEAVIYYSKVIAQKSNMMEAHNNLGDIYFRQKKFSEALFALQGTTSKIE